MSGPFGSTPHNLFNTTGADFYNGVINQSLRFDEGDTAYLDFTPSQDGTDNKKYTISLWVKLAQGSADFRTIFSSKNTGAGTGQGHNTYAFGIDDDFETYTENGAANPVTSTKFRDRSSWYNVVIVYDSTQAVDTSRIQVFINGVRENTLAGTFPGQNSVMSSVNTNGQVEQIGKYVPGYTRYFNGYMAEFHMVDGQALAPTNFGELKQGVWIPKEYEDNGTTSHGVNGFHLTFQGTGTSTTSQGTTAQTNIGDDQSGNGNNFAVYNFGAHDVVPDTPENNWCTFNQESNDDESIPAFSQGGLVVTPPASGGFEAAAATFTLPRTGKWYWEYRTGAGGSSIYGRPGIITLEEFYTQTNDRDEITGGSAATSPNGVLFLANDGQKRLNDSDTSFGNAVSANDIIGQAYNADTGQLYIYINNSIQASGVAISETIKSNFAGQDVFIMHERYNGNGADVYNFGQDSTFGGAVSAGGNADANGRGDFAYAPPSGYLSLCSANLTDTEIGPNVIEQSDDYFNTILYTADGNPSRSITGVGFQPDWLWIKSRNGTYYHGLWDSVRTNKSALYSNTADDEDTSTGATLGSLDADGFTTLNVSGGGFINIGTTTYVAWNWKMGTAFSNDASATSVGSIDSSGSINTKAGQAIISYTGTGSAGTIAHGLDSAPEFIIIKNLDDDSKNWNVHPTILGNSYLEFNRDIAKFTGSSYFNNTAPTNSVFSVGTAGSTNASGDDFIAYVFHSVEGYSKFGSYVGNGNADGVFLHLGFRPAWILTKQTGSGEDWEIWDNTRDPDNVLTLRLKGNTTGADVSSTFMDFVSNGVKHRNTSGGYNESGSEYVYMAFAEAPFKYANAR